MLEYAWLVILATSLSLCLWQFLPPAQTRAQPQTAVQLTGLAFKILLKHLLGFTGYTATLRPHPDVPDQFQLPLLYLEGSLDIAAQDHELFAKALRHEPRSVVSPMFLVATTAPLVITILASRDCPVRPLGAVNTRNVMKFHHPNFCRDAESVVAASRAGNLKYQVSFGGAENPGLRRRRGVEFKVTIQVLNEDVVVLTQELFYLQFLRFNTPGSHSSNANVSKIKYEPEHLDAGNQALVRVDKQDPLKWAAVCKDYNPIHVSRLGAKIFGFKSVIIHGNHLVAFALESLRQQDGSGRETVWERHDPFTLDFSFIKPVLLPCQCTVHWERPDKPRDVELRILNQAGDVCTTGRIQ